MQQSPGGQEGNLEVIARVGNQLHQFFRGDTPEDPEWHDGGPIVTNEGLVEDAAGAPVLIQSTFGAQGNFDLVYPSTNGGIVHLYRDNDAIDTNPPWYTTGAFGTHLGVVDGVTLIQSNYTAGGQEGNLEVITRVGNQLHQFFRGDTPEDPEWHDGGPIVTNEGLVEDAAGAPVLIQSTFGAQGNFDLVYPSTNGGIVHLYRDNDAGGDSPPWYKTGAFGTHLGVSSMGLP